MAIASIVTSTWDSRRTVAPARAMFFATDVGDGCLFQYSTILGRWRVVNGTARIVSLPVPVSGIGNVETAVLWQAMPLQAWQVGDVLRLHLAGGKSGNTDEAKLTVRVGTSGTTQDAAVAGLDGLVLANGVNRSFGVEFDIKLVAPDRVKRLGADSAHGSYAGAGPALLADGTQIPSAAVYPLIVTVALASSGAVDTVFVDDAGIELRTP